MKIADDTKATMTIVLLALGVMLGLAFIVAMNDARNEALSITLAPDRTVYRATYISARHDGGVTRSGERLDSRAYVCAVKRRLGLRFGELLIAQSVEDSERHITVARIVDWLPDDAKSDVDLSEAAFAAIAPLERGVVLVTIRRL